MAWGSHRISRGLGVLPASDCERHGVGYLVGLARNQVLEREAAPACEVAKDGFEATGRKSRLFTEFEYAARTWRRRRRVIARIEHGPKGRNPRFIVTNLDGEADELYDQVYCQRGDMENRIKEQQLALFAERTSLEVVDEPVPVAARGAGVHAARNDAPHGPARDGSGPVAMPQSSAAGASHRCGGSPEHAHRGGAALRCLP